MSKFVKGLILFSIFIGLIVAATVTTIQKSPYEQFTVTLDFTAAVGTDAFTLDSVSAINMDTKKDSTSLVVAASPVPAILPMTKKVVFAVTGGVSRQTHLVSVKVTDTVNMNRYEGQVILEIQ